MQNLADSVRSAMVDGACALLDAGAGDPTLRVRTSGDTDLLVITLHATDAVAAAVAGVGTLNDPQTGGGSWATFSQNPSATGTAAKAVLCDGDATALIELTVGTGAAEVNFDSLSFDTAVAITMTTAPTVTQPAS